MRCQIGVSKLPQTMLPLSTVRLVSSQCNSFYVYNEFMFCQAGSVENEPIRIRVGGGGGEDSKTGDFLMHFAIL